MTMTIEDTIIKYSVGFNFFLLVFVFRFLDTCAEDISRPRPPR